MKKYIFFLAALMSLCACQKQKATVTSPDGNIAVQVWTNDSGEMYYSASLNGISVLDASRLGLILNRGDYAHFSIKGFQRSSQDETWEQPWGERRLIRNHYNQLTVRTDKLNIIFRVFDEGFGFRYELLSDNSADNAIEILDELTEFAFPTDAEAWSGPTNHTNFLEELWTKTPLSQKDTVATPLTVEVNDSLYMVVHEANLTDYASLDVAPLRGSTMKATLVPWQSGVLVYQTLPFVTPWRTILIAKRPGDLITSYMELNLNEPCKIDDTSWIEPQRYIGIWWGMHMKNYTWEYGPKHGATTENTKRYIDFAAQHGFGGVLVEGWNKGWDGDWTRIDDHFSYTEPYPDYDLQELCRYAAERGVRIIAHTETGGAVTNFEQQMDSAFALYERLGIRAVKTGYVNPKHNGEEWQRSQYGVQHYRKVVETAAKYHIMIDNHEPAMPTGIRRTYPNLMTGEGVRGQEWNAWSVDGGNPPYHTCVLPFTRGLAGPMDFTPVIFNFNNKVLPETHPHSTIAKQLAEFLILYSPLQMAADMIENMEGQVGLQFIESCPTTWEETIVCDSKIGEYIIEARRERNGDNWFIGGITNEQSRDFCLNLDFLDENARYMAKIFKDGKNADYESDPYDLVITKQEVTSETSLPLHLARSGGVAIQITKL